jgi:hypothetical protein
MNGIKEWHAGSLSGPNQHYVQQLETVSRQQRWELFKVLSPDAPMVRQSFTDKSGWTFHPYRDANLDLTHFPTRARERVAQVRSMNLPIQGWIVIEEPKPLLGNRKAYLTPQQIKLVRSVLIGTAVMVGAIALAVVAVVVVLAIIQALAALVILGLFFAGLAGVDPVLVVAIGDDPDHCVFVQVDAWLDEA